MGLAVLGRIVFESVSKHRTDANVYPSSVRPQRAEGREETEGTHQSDNWRGKLIAHTKG